MTAGATAVGISAEVDETVIDDVSDFISRFCVFPDTHARTAVTLWAAHAHVLAACYTTPRLALLSPEAGSGKTRVLEVLETLVPDPMMSLSASPAAIFRVLNKRQITLLFDEVDAIWNARGSEDGREDLRALLNAGYKRGARIPRCVGPQHDVVEFSVFCAVALAGLGDLPQTIMSRAIAIRMRKRAPDEHVAPFRARTDERVGHALRDRLAAWADKVRSDIELADPTMPPGIVDRPAEVWEPLLAVADQAGGAWPQRAREACVAMCRAGAEQPSTLGVRLLSDMRAIFDRADSAALYSDTLVDNLTSGDALADDAPWSDLRGRPLTVRKLATMLRRYEVRPRKVREPGGPPKQGYAVEDLYDAWRRYVPRGAEQPEQPEQSSAGAGSDVPDHGECSGSIRNTDADPEHQSSATARDARDVPDVPASRAPCPRCAGEGCRHCEANA